jgi:hypothetical protein
VAWVESRDSRCLAPRRWEWAPGRGPDSCREAFDRWVPSVRVREDPTERSYTTVRPELDTSDLAIEDAWARGALRLCLPVGDVGAGGSGGGAVCEYIGWGRGGGEMLS